MCTYISHAAGSSVPPRLYEAWEVIPRPARVRHNSLASKRAKGSCQECSPCNMHAALFPSDQQWPNLSGLSGTPKRTVYCATATTASTCGTNPFTRRPPTLQQHAPPISSNPCKHFTRLLAFVQSQHTQTLKQEDMPTHTHVSLPLSSRHMPYPGNPVLVAPCSNSGWLLCHLVTSHGRTHAHPALDTLAAQERPCCILHSSNCMRKDSTASACITPLPLLECPVVQRGPRAGPAGAEG